MKKIIFNLLVFIMVGTVVSNADCYTQDRMKTYSLFEKAFKEINVPIKNLYWLSEQTNVYGGGYAMMMTFDGKSKRGSIQYDKQCIPQAIKISSGYGEVTMYYYDVTGSNIKLRKTRKNTYRK